MKTSPSFLLSIALVAASALAAGCAPPKRDLTPDQIDKLDDLEKVMDVQATVSDPQFAKMHASTYGDADWAGFADMGTRLQATSRKIHQFSKGPDFDAFADKLHSQAEALSSAANAKDASRAASTLTDIKATCKACHAKFR
jgi:cytochrome c556